MSLANVLSITTHRLVADRGMDAVYDVLSYLTGEQLWTHQLPRAMDQVEPFLRSQVPQLYDLDLTDLDELLSTGDKDSACSQWVARQARKFGTHVTLKPCPGRDEPPPNPVQEAIDMFGKDKVGVWFHEMNRSDRND